MPHCFRYLSLDRDNSDDVGNVGSTQDRIIDEARASAGCTPRFVTKRRSGHPSGARGPERRKGGARYNGRPRERQRFAGYEESRRVRDPSREVWGYEDEDVTPGLEGRTQISYNHHATSGTGISDAARDLTGQNGVDEVLRDHFFSIKVSAALCLSCHSWEGDRGQHIGSMRRGRNYTSLPIMGPLVVTGVSQQPSSEGTSVVPCSRPA